MATAATPETRERVAQPVPIETLDVPKSVLDAQKKLFMEKSEQVDKVKALNAYLRPLIAKGYIIHSIQGKFTLKEGPHSTNEEKQKKTRDTLVLVNKQLAEMQDLRSGKVQIANKPNTLTNKYVLQDVFNDTLSDLLVDSALVNSIKPQQLSQSSSAELTSLAHEGKLGALGALLNATENVKGDDLRQRNEAIQLISNSMQQAGAVVAQTQTSSSSEVADWGETWMNVKNAVGNPFTKVGGGLRFMTGNLASKGPVALVDSMPKLASLFAMLFAFMIPKGAIKNLLIAGTASHFLYRNSTQNQSLFKDTAGFVNLSLGGKPKTGFENKPGDTPGAPVTGVDTTQHNTNTPESTQRNEWLDKLNGKLPEADLNILREVFSTPVSKVLSEVQIDRKNLNSSADQWDISIKKVSESASTLLSQESKDRLKSSDGEFSSENVEEALYRLFERIGTTWKREIVTSNDIQNGNAFAADRTPAYLGWLVMSKVFSAQSQGDVNSLAKKYIDPDQKLGIAGTLLLDRAPIRNTNEPYDNARNEIARIISGHETWATDAAKKENPAGSNTQKNTTADTPKTNTDSTTNNNEVPGATTAPGPAFERTPENINRALRIKELKRRGTYSREDIIGAIKLKDPSGLFQGKIEQMMETQVNNSVILLAQGHIGQVEVNVKKLLGQFKTISIGENGAKMEEQKALRSLYLRFYEDDRLLGHEPRIEELIRRLSPSLMHL